MNSEVSKAEFKNAYMTYRSEGDGWSDNYWNQFYAHQEGKRYFIEEPESDEHTRMFVNESSHSVHIYFMTSESEESLFDYPGKE